MRTAVLVAAIVGIVVIMWDAFEALVLPRRVTRRLRPTRMFYRATWGLWSSVAGRMAAGRRETYLSFYGPMSMLLLLGAWAASLIVGFALVQWGLGSRLLIVGRGARFVDDLYMSGTTFFTLGLGDVTPLGGVARVVTVIESGLGFGFLAAVIGYLPVVYQAFSRREVAITLLDARAGSPPSAAELLHRYAEDPAALEGLLHEWEHWAAELLESHISYPVLSYYRSQHDNQSWVAALTTLLDTSALVLAGGGTRPPRQARMTFAVARHAAVDLAQVLHTPPYPPVPERLTRDGIARLRSRLAGDSLPLLSGDGAEKTLAELREMYEPYVNALACRLRMPLPAWGADTDAADNWRTSAWQKGEDHR
jgi:ion channel